MQDLVSFKLLVAACGIWFPDQGLNPGPLHWELGVLSTGPPGKSLFFFFGHASWLVGFSTQPGIDFMPPAMEGWNPNCWTTREFPQWFLIYSQLYTYHQYLI